MTLEETGVSVLTDLIRFSAWYQRQCPPDADGATFYSTSMAIYTFIPKRGQPGPTDFR